MCDHLDEKKRVILWGKGALSNDVLESLNPHFAEVIGWIDRRYPAGSSQGIIFLDPETLKETEYDLIVVTVLESESIKNDIGRIGIPDDKVVYFWEANLGEDRIFIPQIAAMRLEIRKLNYAVLNAPYEVEKVKKPRINSILTTLNGLIQSNASICRFGDGEYRWILNTRLHSPFQSFNEEMSDRLLSILQSRCDGIMIAISDIFGSLSGFLPSEIDYYRELLNTENMRERLMRCLDMNRVYENAFISRPYWLYSKNKDRDFLTIFMLWKELWKNRDVLIVEGEYVRAGIGNDLFSGCRSVKRILCPYKNAFEFYGEILDTTVSTAKKGIDMVLLSLGPTATIMAYDLAKKGIRAIDIGQIDLEYEWFLRKTTERIRIPFKGVPETKGAMIPDTIPPKEYLEQVCAFVHTCYDGRVNRTKIWG